MPETLPTSRANRLRNLFEPRSIAVVGASESTDKLGGRVVASLLFNAYRGQIYPVNPGRQRIQGLAAFPSLEAIGAAPNLAILCLPAKDIEAAARIACQAGAGALIVFASGFAELGEDGRARQQRITDIVRSHGVPLIGPNCLGVMDGNSGMVASSTSTIKGHRLKGGRLGFISQSGAIGTFWIDKVREAGFGFSKWTSTGNEADVDLAAALEYYAEDDATEVICFYAEGFRDGPALRRALAEAAARRKPVIAMKAGRSDEGAAAAQSHTGALAGEDRLYDALFERYGVCRVGSLTEMIDVARVFLTQHPPAGRRLAVVTLSGGIGALMTDAAVDEGFVVPELSDATAERLRPHFPDYVNVRNPIDLTDRILTDTLQYGNVLEVLMDSGDFDYIATFMAGRGENLVSDATEASLRLFPHWQGGYASIWQLTTPVLFARLKSSAIAVYDEFLPAIRALGRARTVIERWAALVPERLPAALPLGISRPLAEHAAKQLLEQRFGLVRPQGFLAQSADEAAERAAALPGPFAIKLQSTALMHKTGSGGIALGVTGEAAVRGTTTQMLQIARERGIACDGVLVEQMEAIAFELMVGLRRDAVLGPFLLLGRGGTAVEIDPDIGCAMLPVDAARIDALLQRLRCYPLLAGHRSARPAPLAELGGQLARLCEQFAADPGLAEIEINPLAITRDCRIIVIDAAVSISD